MYQTLSAIIVFEILNCIPPAAAKSAVALFVYRVEIILYDDMILR